MAQLKQIFDTLASDERDLVYWIAGASLLIGVLFGVWFYNQWTQLVRMGTQLVLLGGVAAGLWFLFLSDVPLAPAPQPAIATQPSVVPVAPVSLPPPAAVSPSLPQSPSGPPPEPGSGDWWE